MATDPLLAGKVLVITGASSGIGAALAKRACVLGAMVVLAARTEDKLMTLANTLGTNQAFPVVTDVTKRSDHINLLSKAINRFGHVDVWINNAGKGITKSIIDVTDEDFDEMMLVNTKSALYGMQEVWKHFSERKAGHIINVSSVLGRLPFAMHRSTYCASKHALNSITTSFRLEARARGLGDSVHVSLVNPGLVSTEFGINARGGGLDSRTLPGAQPVDEVADVILDVIRTARADLYSRPQYKDMVADYFTADRIEEVEALPPWVPTTASPSSSSTTT